MPEGTDHLAFSAVLGLLAHAAPISYRFPLPIWLYVLAGGAAVLLSAPAAALAVQPLPYPARLGQWPAVALLLVWSWMELIWPPAKEPRSLALILIVYIVATIVGSALYGAEAWLGSVEVFSVFARTLSRFSPL